MEVRPLEYGVVREPCPCCGSVPDVDTALLGFDYWRGLVFRQHVRVWLSPTEADILKILLDRWPEVTNRHTLLVGLYGSMYQEKVGRGTRVITFLSRLRRKLRTFNLDIKNVPGRGWFLTRPAPLQGLQTASRFFLKGEG